MHRPEPQTRRGSSRTGPDSTLESGPFRDPWLSQRQVLHDAANWITVLLGHVEALAEAGDRRDYARHLELARRAARAAHRLCALPPGPARPGTGIDGARHARRVVEHLRGIAARQGIALECEIAEDSLPLVADAPGFDDALLNLLRNALEATPSGGRVVLGLARREPGLVAVQVRDGGPGIAPELRDRLGRPGASTRPGTDRGLGLSRVRSWLESVGARLEIGAAAGGGATIGFALPSAVAGVFDGRGEEDRSARSVLLVEDDLAVAEVLGLLLQADGHRVRHEGDVQGARAGFARGRFDVVLCDQNLPDGSGEDLLRAFAAEDPDLDCFLVTGDPESVHSPPAFLTGMLAKPVSRDDLRRAVPPEPGPPRSSDPARPDGA